MHFKNKKIFSRGRCCPVRLFPDEVASDISRWLRPRKGVRKIKAGFRTGRTMVNYPGSRQFLIYNGKSVFKSLREQDKLCPMWKRPWKCPSPRVVVPEFSLCTGRYTPTLWYDIDAIKATDRKSVPGKHARRERFVVGNSRESSQVTVIHVLTWSVSGPISVYAISPLTRSSNIAF